KKQYRQYCYRTQTINIFTIFNIAHCNPSPVSPTQDHSQRPKQKKSFFIKTTSICPARKLKL
ncbi:hypothetical protein, partial [Escherichia coli]